MNTKSIIHISNLTKTFKDIIAVDNVSLTVQEGDVYGVLGPNGAGKTTTVSMLLGLVEATKGEIEVFGKKVTTRNNEILKNVGALVGARPAYFPYLSGKENVEYIANMFGVPQPRVDEVMEFIGIADAGDRMPNKYSTGMKQRLGIAMAIVHKPKLLILDEPTNGMDPPGMREMRELIKTLAQQGITILLSSHLLHEVEQVCNRVAVFNKGKIVADGSMKELQGEKNIVHIHTNHTDKTIHFLQTIPNLEIKQNGNEIIKIKGISSVQLIENLVKNNLTPTQVYTKGNSLEDLFLQLIENGN